MKKTWRGLMTGILGASMLLGSLGSVSAAPVPKDIQGHWAQTQLQDWLDKGYLGGYPDGTVQPNKAITRGEYVALINRLFGFTDTASISFTDVKNTSWVYSEVAKAVKAGYIGGYENNTFRAASALTRQEAAVIAAKVLSLNTSSSSTSFKDNTLIAAWAKGAVAAAADKKIINGYPDGSFGPKRSLTRAEAVGIISNSVIFNPPAPGGTVTPTPTPVVSPIPDTSATPTPTPTPVAGGGSGGVITTPSVSGVSYGQVGSVTGDVYLTSSVTGAVYYVVTPYSSSTALPSAAQVKAGVTGAGTAGVTYGTKATSAGTNVAFSLYGLSADTEYAVYVAVVDTAGNWSAVSALRLTTAPSSAISVTHVEPGQAGTVTADVYVTYGQTGGPSAPVRYVVLPATAADPTAAQIAAGQDGSGTQLTAPWTGWITSEPSPAVRQTLSLTGLSTNTNYKIYFITGSGAAWSPVEILRIQTK